MYYISQTTPNNCGFTCLKIVLANLNHDENFLFIKDQNDNLALSLRQIIQIASFYKLNLSGFALEDKDELLNNTQYPIFAIISTPSQRNHCIIVDSIKRKRVKIIDPDIGIYFLRFKKFKEIFTGKGLLISNYELCKCEVAVPNIICIHDYLLNGFIQFLGTCCLAAGLFFLDNKTQPFLPLTLLFFFLVFEVLNKHHNFLLMKKLDDYYINNNNFTIKNYPLYLNKFEEYKKDCLVNPMRLILSLLVCLFIVVITILNNAANLTLIALPFCLSLIDVFIVNPLIKRKENSVKTLEDGLNKVKTKLDFKETANVIHDQTYDYAKIQLLKKYLYIFFMIASSILVMFIQKSIILPYLVFYVMIQILFMDNLSSLLSYSNKHYDILKKKAMLINCIEKE